MARHFTWIQFTDLHIGMDGTTYRWPAMQEEILDDLKRLIGRVGQVDAILFTGDLTQYGSEEQFRKFDETMNLFRDELRKLDSDPVFLAVPGNHDLVRPPSNSAILEALSGWAERPELRERFWSEPDSDYRIAVRAAFANWTAWAGSGIPRDRLEEYREGMLPGDFLATWRRDDLRVGIVGLNTAALQLGDGDYRGRLSVHPRQLAALDERFDRWAKSHDACLLMTHHDESWLDADSSREFRELYKPERFVLHLCGHTHLQQDRTLAEGSAPVPRRTLVGRALFGQERLANGQYERLYGYSINQIEFGTTRILRRWPRADAYVQNGTRRIGPDPSHVPSPGTEHTPLVDLEPSPRAHQTVSTYATPPGAELLREVAAWLEREYRRPPAKAGLLREAGLQGDGTQPWFEILQGLPGDRVRDLLEVAGEPSEVNGFLSRLQRSSAPADFESLLERAFQDQIEIGADFFRQERYEDAEKTYRAIAERAGERGDSGAMREIRERARLNQAAALSGSGDFEGSLALLLDIDPKRLNARGRINLGRFLAGHGELDRALESIDGVDEPGVQVVRQLVALRQGEIPDEPVDDADVLLRTAVAVLNLRRCSRAAELAMRASYAEDLNERGRQHAAEILGKALLQHWLGESVETMATPQPALSRLEDLASGVRDRADWHAVDILVAVCNDLPLPDSGAWPVQQVDGDLNPWIAEHGEALRASDIVAALRELAVRWPQVGPVLLTAADAMLRQEYLKDAEDHARRAFALLPGYGQRQLLARVLLATGAVDELRQHLETLRTPQPKTEMAWDLLLGAALREHLGDPLQIVLAWGKAHPDSSGQAASEVLVRMRRAEVHEARSAAKRALQGAERLALHAFRGMAAAALAEEIDRDLVRRILDALEREDLRGDADAEAIRHELLMATGAKSERAIDWTLLQTSGFVQPLTLDDAVAMFRRQQDIAVLADGAWRAGAVPFESWSAFRGLRPGMVALDLQRGALSVVPPLPVGNHSWRGRNVHIGGLGIEILVALGLHRSFGEAVARLVLFDDTRARIARGAVEPSVAAMQVELVDSNRMWSAFADLPQVDSNEPGAVRMTGTDVPAVAAWLGSLGAARRQTSDAPWSPPAGMAVLDSVSIYELHARELSESFLTECRRQGVVVGVARDAVLAREARRREIGSRISASELATEQWRWLSSLENQGKVRVVPVPEGPILPPSSNGQADTSWLTRAFATRELMQAQVDLVLVTSELVELGLSGFGPPALVLDRTWTKEGWETHQARYEAISLRSTTLGQLVRDLAPPVSRAEAVGRLASAGYPDALEAADVRAMFDDYGGLHGVIPRKRLLGLVQSLHRHEYQLYAPVVARHALFPLTSAVLNAWLGEKAASDAEALTIGILDTIDAMDRSTGHRHRLVDLALYFLVGLSLGSPQRFFVPAKEGRVETSPESQGQRLWRTIAAWAHSGARRASLDLALAQGVKDVALAEFDILKSVFGCVLAEVVRSGRTVDLSGIAMSAALNMQTALSELFDTFHIQALDRAGQRRIQSIREWRDAALQNLPPVAEDIDFRILVEGVEVRLPIEGALPELMPLASNLAQHLRAHDGHLAVCLAQWTEYPTDLTLQGVRTALDRSPLRAVRADPRILSSWSPWADRVIVGPTRLSELLELLSEPPEPWPNHSLNELLAARIGEGGAWEGDKLNAFVGQLARIPGTLAVFGGHHFPIDTETLPILSRIPEQHRHLPVGALVSAIVALGIAGKDESQRRFGDLEVHLPELVARSAAAALDPSGDEDDYAAHEPALIRVCGATVEALASSKPLPPGDRIWLSWRLFAWLTEQILHGRDPHAGVRAVSEVALEPRPSEACYGDLYDPWRIGRGRVDTRELAVLQALSFLRTEGEVDWRLLQPTLLRLASRAYTPDERDLRESWRDPSLGGIALVAPDLARWLALGVDIDAISFLEADERMSWLDDALRPRPTDHPLRLVSNRVLLAFGTRAHQWTDAESNRVHGGLANPDFTLDDLGSRILFLSASSRAADDASMSKAWSVVLSALDEPTGLFVVGEWFLAAARHGNLGAAVSQLRVELESRGVAELQFLQGLSRVLMAEEPSVREQAVDVLRQLLADPRLAASDALGPLASYVRHPAESP